jgi:hypothetical protein
MWPGLILAVGYFINFSKVSKIEQYGARSTVIPSPTLAATTGD